MKKKILCLVLIAATILASFAALQHRTPDSSANRSVIIAYNPNAYASAVSHIMIDRNILSNYLPSDVEVEWVEMSSASDIRDALASGSVHIATPALTAFISARENNLPIRLISNYGSAQVKVYGTAGINDLNDIGDESVIAIKGLNTNPHIAFLAYCSDMGYDIDFFTSRLCKVPETETIGMLNNQSVSAAVLSYPTTKKVDNLSNINMFIDLTDVCERYSLGTVVCVNEAFYLDNPDIVETFEMAHHEIVAAWDADIEINAPLLATRYNTTVDEIKLIMCELPPTTEIRGYDQLANLMYRNGMLKAAPIKFVEIMNE